MASRLGKGRARRQNPGTFNEALSGGPGEGCVQTSRVANSRESFLQGQFNVLDNADHVGGQVVVGGAIHEAIDPYSAKVDVGVG